MAITSDSPYNRTYRKAVEFLNDLAKDPSGKFGGSHKIRFWSNGQCQVMAEVFEKLEAAESEVVRLTKLVAELTHRLYLPRG